MKEQVIIASARQCGKTSLTYFRFITSLPISPKSRAVIWGAYQERLGADPEILRKLGD